MLIRGVTLAILLTLPMCSCAPAVDLEAEEEAIRAVSTRWLELSKQRDAAGVAGLFAEDGAVYWEDRPATVGRGAIEEFMDANLVAEGSFGPDRIDVAASGDLAVEQGSYQGATGQGRYVTVYRKAGDEWKVQADMSIGTSPEGGAPDWARESLASWYERFNARDAEGLADLYTADARVGNAQGRAAIVEQFRSAWTARNESCSGGFDEFVVVQSLAAGWGRDTCIATPPDGGATIKVISDWLAVYERQHDGGWLLIRDFAEDRKP